MKKILLVFITGLLVFLSIPYNENVNAISEYDKTDNWEIYNFYTTYYGMRFTEEITTDVKTISLTLPAFSTNTQTEGGIESVIKFSIGATVLVEIEIETIWDYTENITFFLDLENVGGVDVTTATSILIIVMQDTSSFPSNFLYQWKLASPVLFNSNIINLNYYYKNELIYHSNFFEEFPAEYELNIEDNELFIGWKTITGELFDFKNVIIEDDYLSLEDGLTVFNLYGYVISVNTQPAIETPIITANVPIFISSLLGVFNGNNLTGYIIFYVLVSIVVILLMVIFHLPIFAIVLTHLFITITFVFMGMLPTFLIIILSLFYVLTVIQAVKNLFGAGSV